MQQGYFEKNVFAFGQKKLIVFLATLNAFVPLSIDLYLPALPHMTEVFTATEATAKLTLSMFMLFFGLSMLVWGPVSDRIGRKAVLRSGLTLYTGASIFCVFAGSMEALVAGRIVQALGCGAISSVSMAIVKDTFRGRIMENVLVWIQTMTILCPMLAPLLGGFLLRFTSWRGLFWILAGAGVIAFCLAFALKETLKQPSETPVWMFTVRIHEALKDRGLRSLLFLFALTPMPFMAYLATSSFIYTKMFACTSQEYSYFFAANACASLVAPLAYVRIFRELPRKTFLSICFCVTALCGGLLLFFGGAGPFAFAALFLPLSFMGSASRPAATVLIMSQRDRDNGTVASLMGSSGLFFGSISMLISSLAWPSPVFALGAISLGSGCVCLCIWLFITNRKLYKDTGK